MIDEECRDLCDAMNALPGIETSGSCCGQGRISFSIYFEARSGQGLFFLVRCVDSRYWKYGQFWNTELSVGDQYEDGYLPVC